MPRPTSTVLAVVLAFFALVPARADEAAQREVEKTLADMAAAVLSADRDRFLAFIGHDDPCWVVEQAHWADQLEKYRPAEFSLVIGEGEASFEAAAAEFPLVMSWRIDTGPATSWGAGGQKRTVTFPPAIFRKAGGTAGQDGRWLWCGTRWETLHGEGFIVRYLPGDEAVAQDVLKAFPIAKAHADSVFGIQNAKLQTIELFRSMDHLKATVYMNMPDHYLGGWNEAGESIKFMTTYTRGVRNWTWAFAHEYGHVATRELGPRASEIPWWVAEGAAEFSSAGKKPGAWQRADAEVRTLAAEGKLPRFEQLSDYVTCEPPLKHLAYTQGHHMVRFITEKAGDEGRNRWLTLVCEGRTLDEASRQVLGIDFAALDSQWRATLPQPAVAEGRPPASGSAAPPPQGAGQGEQASPDPLRDAARAGVVELARRMSVAAAAGEEAAYMACVSGIDPVFFKEQENWARDFSRHKPASVEFALDGEGTLKDGAFICPLKTVWRMEGGRDRNVKFSARFVRSDEGWLYAGEDWQVLEVDGVRAMYLDDNMAAAARSIVEIFPAIREHVHEGFELSGHKPLTERVQEVKLYPSMRHLQHSIYLSYTDSLGGWNEPGESIKLLAPAGSRAGYFSTVLAHEYGHVATFELGPRANDMPWWILEGVAELSAEKYSRDSAMVDRMNRRWAASGGLVEWERLADFHGEAVQHQAQVYKQGQHMLGYISTRFGRTRRNDWMRAMSTGSTLDGASRDVLGLSFEQLDRDWRESLKAAPPEETAKPSDTRPTPPVGDTPKHE
jgi:hypothetical protein